MRKLSPFELDQFDDEKEIQNYYERYERDYNKWDYNRRRHVCKSFLESKYNKEDGDTDSGSDLPRYAAGNI